jgi:nicotinate phosphoribosyltransferase
LGIGTWFGCDIPGIKPLNQVMKMTAMMRTRNEPQWTDVIKISDSHGKEIGNPDEVELAKKTLKIS